MPFKLFFYKSAGKSAKVSRWGKFIGPVSLTGQGRTSPPRKKAAGTQPWHHCLEQIA